MSQTEGCSQLFPEFMVHTHTHIHVCTHTCAHTHTPLCCGCAREPKRTGEARTAHPPASRREDELKYGISIMGTMSIIVHLSTHSILPIPFCVLLCALGRFLKLPFLSDFQLD